ncbi:MAG: hypothetical protein IMX00_09415 [Limnochordales bacterium]|nr:hypothetical protein [Limnochordales bacterium]
MNLQQTAAESVNYRRGSRPELEQYVAQATAGALGVEERVNTIVRFRAKLSERAPAELEAMVLGGAEEEITARGSDWCTDLARVTCARNRWLRGSNR